MGPSHLREPGDSELQVRDKGLPLPMAWCMCVCVEVTFTPCAFLAVKCRGIEHIYNTVKPPVLFTSESSHCPQKGTSPHEQSPSTPWQTRTPHSCMWLFWKFHVNGTTCRVAAVSAPVSQHRVPGVCPPGSVCQCLTPFRGRVVLP